VLALWEGSRSSSAVTTDTPEAVEALIGQPGSVLLLAFSSDVLAGTLVAAWDGWRGNMYRLAVRPELRRLGIASALVEAGHSHLRSIGARRVTALVGRDERAAQELWRAAGYEADPVHGRYVRDI
jgi:ribosomal protein S18 acetylase RimI-like enzyme